MTAAIQLGTAHPPGLLLNWITRIGYPLITLVGHLFSRLFSFIGNPALVLNVLSVLFACVASFFLCGTVYYLTNGDAIASVASSRSCCLLVWSSHSLFWLNLLDPVCSVWGVYNEQYVHLYRPLPYCSVLLPLLERGEWETFPFSFPLICSVSNCAKGCFRRGLVPR